MTVHGSSLHGLVHTQVCNSNVSDNRLHPVRGPPCLHTSCTSLRTAAPSSSPSGRNPDSSCSLECYLDSPLPRISSFIRPSFVAFTIHHSTALLVHISVLTTAFLSPTSSLVGLIIRFENLSTCSCNCAVHVLAAIHITTFSLHLSGPI
jgi:hypothetical protein